MFEGQIERRIANSDERLPRPFFWRPQPDNWINRSAASEFLILP